MELPEIENLSAAELKAHRDELVEAAKDAPAEVLAARFVKALTDAKQRDEQLGVQGRTITALQTGVEAAATRSIAAAKAVDRLEAADADNQRQATQREAAMQDQLGERSEAIARMDKQLAEMGKRCERLKKQAEKHAAAIGSIAKLAGNAIASERIDAADQPSG
jgi:flagellin-like hook-associated protein FlgL